LKFLIIQTLKKNDLVTAMPIASRRKYALKIIMQIIDDRVTFKGNVDNGSIQFISITLYKSK